VIGTLLNVAGILAGGLAGRLRAKVLPVATESYLRLALAAFTLFYGLRLSWTSLGGSALHILKQVLALLLALMVGRLTGRLLRLQKLSNRLGHAAQQRLMGGQSGGESRFSAAFKTSSVLFCLPPLGIVGALVDGLNQPGYFYPLAIKAVIDGLASMALVLTLGWGVLVAAIPVLAVQGTISLACASLLHPLLSTHAGMIDSINCVAGVLFCAVALIMLGVKRIELTDYLPSLAVAPVLTWLLV
jgi:uncharacterized protein